MGQAVADLPDPLQSSPPADAQSADDLLSQLAGDEIDRLLAESEGATPPAPAEVAAATAPATAPASTSLVEAVVEPPAESVDLDAVLDTAVAEHKADAEKHALQEAATHSPPKPSDDHSPQIELGDASRVPLFLRPLEWLSSPLDPWPDQFRDLLGKVGLMTLVNALAVLAYVLLVRRHHH